MNDKKPKQNRTTKDNNSLRLSSKNSQNIKKTNTNNKNIYNTDKDEIIVESIEIDAVNSLDEKLIENIEEKIFEEINEIIQKENNDINDTKKENSKKLKKESKIESKFIKKNNKPHKIDSNKDHLWDCELIKLINVSKSYTNNYTNYNILHDINLTIYEKEFVVIYGPSGSGKTTLLSIISALDRPTTGTSYVVGQNTISLNESKLTKLRSNYIGYIYQQYGLLDILTVEDNIKITEGLQKDKSKKIDLDELLKYVGLYEHKKKKASQLSGGQSQRVAICRALIKNPKILFGDEPTGAIHIDAAKQIMNLFLKINKEYGTTIVIVTHNQNMLKLGDRVIKVQDGKIVENYLNKHRTPVEKIMWDDQE